MDPEEKARILGHVDEYREGRLHGWAWQPGRPLEPVTVEVLVDGAVVAETVACLHRSDLSAAGIGHGRHAFAVPVDLDAERLSASRLIVRVKEGDPIPGQLRLGVGASLQEPEQPDDLDTAAFIADVLAGARPVPDALATAAVMNFIVYSATAAQSLAASLGGAEYSYYFVMRAFVPVLRRLGTVHTVSNPASEVDPIYTACRSRGESCLFVNFGPPHLMVQGLRCPTIPVIAWEFPTIPSEIWNEDVRNDWRRMLRHTGSAFTLSEFAATSVRKAMGDHFPVLAVPAPVWNRSATADVMAPLRRLDKGADVEVEGFVFDTRGRVFRIDAPPPSPPGGFNVPSGEGGGAAMPSERTTLDGVVFTSVFAPKDGRKNWQDMLTAFIAAFRSTPDATLVFKMIGREPAYWWWEFQDIVARLPSFDCRVVVLHGFLDDACYQALIDATHWVVNTSHAEGLCLPLLEFMSAGRPALAPAHTAMADYINEANALIVRSEEEYCSWPNDPRNHLTTTRHRIEWPSVRDAMRDAYRIAKTDAARYAAMSESAMGTMRSFCADDVIAGKIASFLGIKAAQTEASQGRTAA